MDLNETKLRFGKFTDQFQIRKHDIKKYHYNNNLIVGLYQLIIVLYSTKIQVYFEKLYFNMIIVQIQFEIEIRIFFIQKTKNPP